MKCHNEVITPYQREWLSTKRTATSVGKYLRKAALITAGGNVICSSYFWKSIWTLLTKIGSELPYNPVIALLSIYFKGPKAQYRKDICTPVFIAAMFIIAKKIRK